MTLEELIENVDFETDETFDDETYINAANKALSIINVECNTKFSDIKSMTELYTELPVKWMVTLLDPYIAWTVKMNDTSLNEADRYLEEFYRFLEQFKNSLGTLVQIYNDGDTTNGVSPDSVIQEGFGGVYGLTTENAINMGWFSRSGNGSSF